MNVPFVHSGYDRRENDHYPTVDARCPRALWESWPVPTPCWDPCAPSESGIAAEWPGDFVCTGDALNAPVPDGVLAAVYNPPYKPEKVCAQIISRMRDLVASGELIMAAALMRPQWDYGKTRCDLFDQWPYAGQVHMRFRPYWTEDRAKTPIHNYQWLIWDRRHRSEPVVRYWPLSVREV